jgi:hypothetical protein
VLAKVGYPREGTRQTVCERLNAVWVSSRSASYRERERESKRETETERETERERWREKELMRNDTPNGGFLILPNGGSRALPAGTGVSISSLIELASVA